MFFVAYLIIALACASITIKTLVGYSDISFINKILISAIVVFGWVAPLVVNGLKHYQGVGADLYSSLYSVGYTLLGFVFILFCLLMIRDLIWYGVYGSARALGMDGWSLNPKNISVLWYANLIVILLSIIICSFALYNGTKVPDIKEIKAETPLVKKDLRIVQLSDLHINRTTPVNRVHRVVEAVNNLNPDIIVLTGDIGDDDVGVLDEQLAALQYLSAPYGIYASIGNHEFYNGLNSWIYQYGKMGFEVLFNKGMTVANDIFIAGIPDAFTANSDPSLNVNFSHSLSGSNQKQYKILLSHNPELANSISSFNFQMMLAGHTHGGQIFPFHIFVKKANQYLSGDYDVNGIKLHVSNGAGTWGPKMRLFASSEITVIDLIKK